MHPARRCACRTIAASSKGWPSFFTYFESNAGSLTFCFVQKHLLRFALATPNPTILFRVPCQLVRLEGRTLAPIGLVSEVGGGGRSSVVGTSVIGGCVGGNTGLAKEG
ncbi:hypothetical protein AL350_gp19 [Equine adenovirus 2]|uniref:Uncharacterized protein n=1 Tax=Equine adenovirus B serotype 2 TaxID=67603 RepID=A0A0K1DBU7_ADEE2|nr:hypothetical protein AL350_gp19 [Equine adenovirus 2]AKT26032.1 hypothetical protein [Equine adenovirus 2]